MLDHNVRYGNFSSSRIVELTKTDRSGKDFGKAALTYIYERNMERRLGRSLSIETVSKPTAWGKFCEKVANDRLGMQYMFHSDHSFVHPDNPSWVGTPDGEKYDTPDLIDTVFDFKSPFTLKSFCNLVDPIYEGLTGMEAINAVRDRHESGDDYYYQLTSNAVIRNRRFAELIVYVPFQSEIPEIMMRADGDPNGYFICNSLPGELPYIPDGGYYNNINIIRWEVPNSEREYITDLVKKASERLIPRRIHSLTDELK